MSVKKGDWKLPSLDSSPGLGRRNKPPNQILNRYNPAKIFLSVQDSRQPKPGSAQLLYNTMGGLLLTCGYDAPDIIVQRFASILIEEDIEDVNQSGRLPSTCDHRQTIKARRSAEFHCFLC
jgi:hypothetical protein